MFEQQTVADDPKYENSMGRAEGPKELSKPVKSKVVWKSTDEFSIDLEGTPTTFTGSKKSVC